MRTVVFACLLLGCFNVTYGQQALPRPQPPTPYSSAVATSPTDAKLDDLLKAAAHLEAAGMKEEARKIRQLAEKEKHAILARIETLQAEINRLRGLINNVPHVLVHIKIVELSRTKLRELGFDFQKLGLSEPVGNKPLKFAVDDDNHVVFDVLEALQKDKLLRVLAEPSLVTVSGRAAHIQFGGELPMLGSQGIDSAPIEYKQYGTRLDLVPIVLEERDVIRLELRVRVSEIDRAKTRYGYDPGLNVREIDTGAELRAGQTLVISGLVQNRPAEEDTDQTKVSDTPKAADADQKAEKEGEEVELFVLVTPEIIYASELGIGALCPSGRSPAARTGYSRPRPTLH